MQLKKVATMGMKIAQSPLTGKIIHGARIASDIANIAGVPMTGALSKGLGVAEKVLEAVQK